MIKSAIATRHPGPHPPQIDEYGRFLNSSAGKKTPTQSILEVGLDAAAAQLLDGAGFDREGFYSRDGYYPDRWSRPRGPGHT